MVMCLGGLRNKGSQFISTTTDPKAIENTVAQDKDWSRLILMM